MKRCLFLLSLAAWLPIGASCGSFSVGAEGLYWLPVECGYQWAHQDPELLTPGFSGSVPAYTVSPHYDWGFRVGADYEGDCFFAEVSYLHYHASHTQRVALATQDLALEGVTDDDVNRSNFVRFLSGDGRVKHRYENVDVRLGVIGKQSCRGQVAFFTGARWIDIEEERRARGFDGIGDNAVSIPFLSNTSTPTFWGVGPQLGVFAEYGLFRKLNFYTSASLMALVGERKIKKDVAAAVIGDPPIADDTSELVWQSAAAVSPGFDFEVGLSWEFTCGCWDLTAHMGYEIDYYLNALPLSTGDIPALVETQRVRLECIDIGFAGLTFGLAAGF